MSDPGSNKRDGSKRKAIAAAIEALGTRAAPRRLLEWIRTRYGDDVPAYAYLIATRREITLEKLGVVAKTGTDPVPEASVAVSLPVDLTAAAEVYLRHKYADLLKAAAGGEELAFRLAGNTGTFFKAPPQVEQPKE